MRRTVIALLFLFLILSSCRILPGRLTDFDRGTSDNVQISTDTVKTNTYNGLISERTAVYVSTINEGGLENIVTPPTIITPSPFIISTSIIMVGATGYDESEVYRVELPCWGDRSACTHSLENTFSRNDLFSWGIEISPDGTRMAFLSNYLTATSDIFLYSFIDQRLTRLTSTESGESMLAWSPDGDYIAYTAHDDGKNISVIDDYGNTHYSITTTHSQTFHPSWSNDGTKIAFFANDGYGTDEYLYYFDLFSGETFLLVSGSVDSDYSISWSPDDTKIAFVSSISGTPDISVVELGSLDNYFLTETTLWEREPAWSTDGEIIVYSALDRQTGISSIWTMRNDGSEKTQVSRDNGVYFYPRWIFDSQYIICDKLVQDLWQPVLINTSDQTEIRLAITDYDIGVAWIGRE
jgi:Tol biopolymer transport system component